MSLDAQEPGSDNRDLTSPSDSKSSLSARAHVRRAILPIIDRRFQFKVTLLVVCIITITHLVFGIWMYLHVADFAQKLADYVPDLAPDAHWIETELLKSMILTVITTFLAIFILSLYFSSRISGPLFNMTRVLRQVAGGDFSRRVKLRKSDELKEFSEAVNHLLGSIEDRERRLQGHLDELKDQLKQGKTGAPQTLELLEKAKNCAFPDDLPS